MNKKISFSFIFFFALSISFVSGGFVKSADAYYLQTTATWDIRTPPNTPAGTQDVGNMFPTVTGTVGAQPCPEGTPIGYGTVTPGLPWLLECEHCLPTQTGTPPLDWTAVNLTNFPSTQDLTTTATPYASTTPTPVNTLVVVPNCYTGNVSHIAETNGSAEVIDSDTTYCEVLAGQYHCSGVLISHDVSNTADNASGVTVYFDLPVGVSIQSLLVLETCYTSIGCYNSLRYSSNGSASYSLNSPVNGGLYNPVSVGVNNTISWATVNGGLAGDIHTTTWDLTINYLDLCETGTPTVTPTPMLTTCGEISPDDYNYEDWYKLIVPDGTQACFSTPYLSLPDMFGSGWMQFFSFIFPQPIVDFIAGGVAPAQTWCGYGVGFALWNFFGLQVDPTIFADLGIVLFIIYHFITK